MHPPQDADDMARALESLPAVEGETPAQREARLLQHIGRHLTARDLALRTELRREIARLDEQGAKMDAALHHMGHELAAEVVTRREEDRRLDDAVREIPERIMDLQTTVIREIQRAHGTSPAPQLPTPPDPPMPTPGPTLGTLVLTSRPVQALVAAFALLLAASAVGVLALAIGSDRAGDVATRAVDKLPHYPAPAPIEAPAPSEPSSQPVPSPG